MYEVLPLWGGRHLAKRSIVLENVRSYQVSRYREVITGRKFKIGRAEKDFQQRRVSAYVGAGSKILNWRETEMFNDVERAMIAAHAKFSVDRRGLVSHDTLTTQQFRPLFQRLSIAVASNSQSDFLKDMARLLNEKNLTLSQCIDLLTFMQKQIYSGGFSMRKYKVIADCFGYVLSMLGDQRRDSLRP